MTTPNPGTCPSAVESPTTNREAWVPQELRLRRDVGLLTSGIRTSAGTPAMSCDKCRTATPGCCYKMLLVTVGEALTIIETYPDLLHAMRPALIARHQIEAAHLAPARSKLEYEGKPTVTASVEQWRSKGVPCPFLKVDGRCAIYQARPVACASYATPSAPETCHGSPEHQPVEGLSPEIGAAIMQRQVQLAAGNGIPHAIFGGLASAIVGVNIELGKQATDAPRIITP